MLQSSGHLATERPLKKKDCVEEDNKYYTETEEYKSKTSLEKFKFRVMQFITMGGMIIFIILCVVAFFTLVIPLISSKYG